MTLEQRRLEQAKKQREADMKQAKALEQEERSDLSEDEGEQ